MIETSETTLKVKQEVDKGSRRTKRILGVCVEYVGGKTKQKKQTIRDLFLAGMERKIGKVRKCIW